MELTLFLREAGAPLDNSACERVVKRAIMHRKNSLFYRTQAGAQVGDTFKRLGQCCKEPPGDLLRYSKEQAAA